MLVLVLASSFEVVSGLMTEIHGDFDRLYMVMMAIYRKWQNDLSTDFISLSVLNQSEFPLANHLLSSHGAAPQGEWEIVGKLDILFWLYKSSGD